MSTELKTLNGYGFDATKLGGLDAQYYAQGRAAYNLLDNSDFRNPVNQRGQSSYNGITYTIDRWRSWDSNNITTLNDGNISVSVHIVQNIPKNRFKNGSAYTIALCASDGTIYVNSGVYTPDAEDFGDWTHTWVEITDSGDVAIYLRNGTYVWAALYEGSYTADTLPAYQPKGYAAELAECQLYNREEYVVPITRIRNNVFSIGTIIQMRDMGELNPTITLKKFTRPSVIDILQFAGGDKIDIENLGEGRYLLMNAILTSCQDYEGGYLIFSINADL